MCYFCQYEGLKNAFKYFVFSLNLIILKMAIIARDYSIQFDMFIALVSWNIE